MFVNQTMSFEEMAAAKEKGRKLAAAAMRVNPKSRERVEQRFGVAYCRQHYPEAYSKEIR